MIAARIARRLVRKAVKPAALYLVELQLLASEARESDCITARGVTASTARDERKRRVQLIGRRNEIRGW
jgi:hypothetical protein